MMPNDIFRILGVGVVQDQVTENYSEMWVAYDSTLKLVIDTRKYPKKGLYPKKSGILGVFWDPKILEGPPHPHCLKIVLRMLMPSNEIFL